MSVDAQSLLIAASVLVAIVGIAVRKWLRSRGLSVGKEEQSVGRGSRRRFIQAAATGVALAITSTVLRPVAAFATHRKCEQRGVTGSYNTCLGQCSTSCSSCCRTSPNQVFRDCCTGCCTGSACWRYPQLVVFQIDNSGGCFCYLQSC
jgi:uncharacterized membrane protein